MAGAECPGHTFIGGWNESYSRCVPQSVLRGWTALLLPSELSKWVSLALSLCLSTKHSSEPCARLSGECCTRLTLRCHRRDRQKPILAA